MQSNQRSWRWSIMGYRVVVALSIISIMGLSPWWHFLSKIHFLVFVRIWRRFVAVFDTDSRGDPHGQYRQWGRRLVDNTDDGGRRAMDIIEDRWDVFSEQYRRRRRRAVDITHDGGGAPWTQTIRENAVLRGVLHQGALLSVDGTDDGTDGGGTDDGRYRRRRMLLTSNTVFGKIL